MSESTVQNFSWESNCSHHPWYERENCVHKSYASGGYGWRRGSNRWNWMHSEDCRSHCCESAKFRCRENGIKVEGVMWMDLESVHIEWSESQREKQGLCINAYTWNLEKWYRWTYLQGRNADADVENGGVNTEGGKKGSNELGDWHWHIQSYCEYNRELVGICCTVQGAQCEALWWPRGVGWEGRRRGESRGREYTCTYGWFASLYSRNQHKMASNYNPIEKTRVRDKREERKKLFLYLCSLNFPQVCFPSS